MKEYNDEFVETATSKTIDRSKEQKNTAFIEEMYFWNGLFYPKAAFDGQIDAYGETRHGQNPVLGTKYIRTPTHTCPGSTYEYLDYDTDMICVEQENVCPVCGLRKKLKPYNHRKNEYDEHFHIWMCPECHKEQPAYNSNICNACYAGTLTHWTGTWAPCKGCKYNK